MNNNKIQFGTGGWRAIIGEDFTKENLQLVCQGLTSLIDDTGIVIGFDRRFLSDKSALWAAEVFAGNNKKVWLIDRSCPTPLVMFTVAKRKISHGMMITASHNPAPYNGVKLFTPGGRDADENYTNRLEKLIEKVESVKTLDIDKALQSGIVKRIHPMNEYIDAILEKIDTGAIRKANLNIAIDPMFGVSRTALLSVLITARCDVDIINDRHDTLFGGRTPAPEAGTLHRLRDIVQENGLDLGIATDGDADRIGLIDSEGRYIHPNMILAILYYYLLEYKGETGDAVRNIATTHLLDRIAEDFGQRCHEVPVGFKNISFKMNETDALIGGESSGGLTIRGHINGKDGIYAAAILVELMAVSGKHISEFVEMIKNKYGNMHWIDTSYGYSPEKREELIETLFVKRLLPDFGEEVEKIGYEDGVKVYFKNGDWVIARFSGTETLIRVFSESENPQKAKDYALKFKQFLNLQD